MVDTVFFDFGGVFTCSPFTTINVLGIERGTQSGQFTEIILGSCHADDDHPWHQLERGEISMEAAR